jgi:hypothetical protein
MLPSLTAAILPILRPLREHAPVINALRLGLSLVHGRRHGGGGGRLPGESVAGAERGDDARGSAGPFRARRDYRRPGRRA